MISDIIWSYDVNARKECIGSCILVTARMLSRLMALSVIASTRILLMFILTIAEVNKALSEATGSLQKT